MMCFAQGRNIAGSDVGKEETPQEAALGKKKRQREEWGRMKMENRFERKIEEMRHRIRYESVEIKEFEGIRMVVMNNQINNQLNNQVC